MKTTRSLSFFVTVWMAAAIAASMTGYAAYEHSANRGLRLSELAVHHVGHVLVLGVIIYALCWVVFYFLLLRPLNRIYLHLYTLGSGQLKTLELDSKVREIRTIVDGINLMLSRLKLGANGNALDLAQTRIAEIKELVRPIAVADPGRASALRESLADLEKNLPHILAPQGSYKASPGTVAAGESRTICASCAGVPQALPNLECTISMI